MSNYYDNQRYRAKYAGRWLIDSHNGYGDIPPVNVNGYPAVKQYLDQFYQKLAKRYDKGHTPYNLRNCAYHENFSQEKLFWSQISPEGRFAYFDQSELFCLNSAYMITGTSLKFLCAILNSQLIRWFVQSTAAIWGRDGIKWLKTYIDLTPIPKPCEVVNESFVNLVDHILEAKKHDDMAETDEWEYQIDRMVYNFYGLTDAESNAIAEVLGDQ